MCESCGSNAGRLEVACVSVDFRSWTWRQKVPRKHLRITVRTIGQQTAITSICNRVRKERRWFRTSSSEIYICCGLQFTLSPSSSFPLFMTGYKSLYTIVTMPRLAGPITTRTRLRTGYRGRSVKSDRVDGISWTVFAVYF